MAANPEDLMKVQADPTALMPSAAAAAGAPPVKVLTSLPKGGRPRSDVMETDPVASSRGSSRRREPNTMPARPKSLDAIPRGGHGDDEDELSGDSTDAREMTGQSQHTDTRPLERTAIPRTALAVGGAVAFLLVVRIVMWMASSPTPAAPTNSERPVVAAPSTERPKPEPGQPEAATPPAPVAEENEVALVEFVVHGPAGAVVEIDNQPIKVGEKRRLPPGKVHILYGCPVAKRPAVPQKLINADVELRDRPVVYDLKCPPIVVARPPPPKPPVKAPVKTKGTKPAQGGTKRP